MRLSSGLMGPGSRRVADERERGSHRVPGSAPFPLTVRLLRRAAMAGGAQSELR